MVAALFLVTSSSSPAAAGWSRRTCPGAELRIAPAQSVMYGRSTAFFVFTRGRWRFWFGTGLSRSGW
jgi:hypothetical protein